MPVGRFFLRLVDLLPLPSLRVQRLIAAAVILTQAGISVTGSIVRVTSSGLGCPTSVVATALDGGGVTTTAPMTID